MNNKLPYLFGENVSNITLKPSNTRKPSNTQKKNSLIDSTLETVSISTNTLVQNIEETVVEGGMKKGRKKSVKSIAKSVKSVKNVEEMDINTFWKIQFDHREHSIIELIRDYFSEKSKILWKDIPIEFEYSNLDIGDIHIISPDNQFTIIWERKTLEDWSQSIKDGRYREQKMRLQAYQREWMRTKEIKPIVGYIIEGLLDNNYVYDVPLKDSTNEEDSINSVNSEDCKEYHYTTKISGIPISTLWSSYMHMIIRDQMNVIESKNVANTIEIVFKILETCSKHYSSIIENYGIGINNEEKETEGYWSNQVANTGDIKHPPSAQEVIEVSLRLLT
jgi:ERCC4-type nuclease